MGTSWMIANLDLHYLKFDKSDEWNTNWGLQFFKTTCTWVLIFTNFVPISLLVTLEIVHFFHALFMSYDVMMFDTD
jgi:phospholipid-transporting ATPase